MSYYYVSAKLLPYLLSQVGERVFTIFIGPKSGNGELCRPQVVG